MYVQVIPLYLPDDEDAKAYFDKHHATIDSYTGGALVVVWTKEVKAGDTQGIVAALGSGRFKDIHLPDLPCLVVETPDESFALSLEFVGNRLSVILRTITEKAPSSNTI